MAIILHLDTATPTGSVCLSKSGRKVAEKISTKQKDHASVITPFIEELLAETGTSASQIDAVSISSGPGSYTGLRVATSTAKGLCYALDIPLIAVTTLEMMAYGLKENLQPISEKTIFCPMIDARRKEVFTALYNHRLELLEPPKAAILDAQFMDDLPDKALLVFGTGAAKAKKLFPAERNDQFPDYGYQSSHLIRPAEKKFAEGKFEDVAYFAPFYLKSVYLPGKN